jgi:hypothetical protein
MEFAIPHLSRKDWGVVSGFSFGSLCCITLNLHLLGPGNIEEAVKNACSWIDQMKKKSLEQDGYQYHPPYIATTDHNQTFNIWFKAKRCIAEYFVPKASATLIAGLYYLKYGVERLC